LNRFVFVAAALAAVALGALASGWGPAPGLSEARETWTGEAAQLDETLVALEDRLLANQARVRLWEEMRSRHQTVSQVACENLGEHARALVASDQRTRDQEKARKRSRFIAASATAGGVGGP
jgi:hypothetical protein